jgi:hypothetical protein
VQREARVSTSDPGRLAVRRLAALREIGSQLGIACYHLLREPELADASLAGLAAGDGNEGVRTRTTRKRRGRMRRRHTRRWVA